MTKRRQRRGVALVELAIVLFLLVTIVVGCVDFGRFAYTHIAVTNAAREGAYFATTNPPTQLTRSRWEAAIRDAVVDELSGMVGFDNDRLVVTSELQAGSDPERPSVRVDVSYPFHPILPWMTIREEVPIMRTVEMRVIR